MKKFACPLRLKQSAPPYFFALLIAPIILLGIKLVLAFIFQKKKTFFVFQSSVLWKVTNFFFFFSGTYTRFFLVSNAIGCSYAAASLVISAMARSSGNRTWVLAVTMADLVIAALLFSANGAASAVGVLGQKGNSHVQWMRVCNVFDAYCRHMTAAIVLSVIGSTVFLFLVAHSVLKPHYYRSN